MFDFILTLIVFVIALFGGAMVVIFGLRYNPYKEKPDPEDIKRNEDWLRTFYKRKAAELRGER
ncbi:hypothetical protein [Brevibacillus centrosporus]|uniref:hypothetical protein n=1 Tax=Brevibacillus centrosporus TaxID=54910 RepID=UPI003B02658C